MNKQIVEFKLDEEPVSPKEYMNIMYCINLVDSLAGETSIMKIDTENLYCQEIYQSKFRIVNLSINEDKKESKSVKTEPERK